jgi:hypothetical protein
MEEKRIREEKVTTERTSDGDEYSRTTERTEKRDDGLLGGDRKEETITETETRTEEDL